MENYKLRVKIGAAEFEAEGAEETVKEQFAEFKELLAVPTRHAEPVPANGNGTVSAASAPVSALAELGPDQVPPGFERLFRLDEKDGRKAVTLRLLPQGEDRDSTTLLLLLWAFKRSLGQDQVRVTTLKDVLERSGLTLDRVDRVADKALRHGFVLKGGKAKGGSYALTNTGQVRAEQAFTQLLEQM